MDPQPKFRVEIPPGQKDLFFGLVAAALTPALMEQRSSFIAENGREWTAEERAPCENSVMNEWIRMFRALRTGPWIEEV